MEIEGLPRSSSWSRRLAHRWGDATAEALRRGGTIKLSEATVAEFFSQQRGPAQET